MRSDPQYWPGQASVQKRNMFFLGRVLDNIAQKLLDSNTAVLDVMLPPMGTFMYTLQRKPNELMPLLYNTCFALQGRDQHIHAQVCVQCQHRFDLESMCILNMCRE